MATRIRRNMARHANQTPTGTQYDNIRRSLFDLGNRQPMVPVLAVAKWMTDDDNKHYDDVCLVFTNDLSPLAGRQMVFHIWDRDTVRGEEERNIVGYDAIVPPELDNDPMFLAVDIDPRYCGLYDGFDTSLFADLYWSRTETDWEKLRMARWDIALITADQPDFWEFFTRGGIAAWNVTALFDTKYFARQLYDWARSAPRDAAAWVNSALPLLDKATTKRARQICTMVRKICNRP
jgi:hypothetical protein